MSDFTVSLVGVRFVDGREETVKLGPAALVRIERRWKGRQIPAVESTCFGAWWALGCPGVGSDDDAKFEGWLDTIDAIWDMESEEVVPTKPAP